MPVLEASYEGHDLKLPVSGGTAQVTSTISIEEENQLSAAPNNTERSLIMVQFALRGWDLTDSSGNLLPIDRESIGRLPNQDGAAIIQWINAEITKRKDSAMDQVANQPTREPAEPGTGHEELN